MKKILAILPVLLIVFIACKDDTKTPMSAVSETGKGKVTNDTSGKEMLDNMQAMYSDQQKMLVKVPFEPVPRTDALTWISNYDNVSPSIHHDSLVKRIWLGNKHLGILWLKADSVQVFVALPTANVAGPERKLTVLLQVKLRNGNYEYFDLGRPKEMNILAEDPVFCPPPYPCATKPIEAD